MSASNSLKKRVEKLCSADFSVSSEIVIDSRLIAFSRAEGPAIVPLFECYQIVELKPAAFQTFGEIHLLVMLKFQNSRLQSFEGCFCPFSVIEGGT